MASVMTSPPYGIQGFMGMVVSVPYPGGFGYAAHSGSSPRTSTTQQGFTARGYAGALIRFYGTPISPLVPPGNCARTVSIAVSPGIMVMIEMF
jgi:hypothetical protein